MRMSVCHAAPSLRHLSSVHLRIHYHSIGNRLSLSISPPLAPSRSAARSLAPPCTPSSFRSCHMSSNTFSSTKWYRLVTAKIVIMVYTLSLGILDLSPPSAWGLPGSSRLSSYGLQPLAWAAREALGATQIPNLFCRRCTY